MATNIFIPDYVIRDASGNIDYDATVSKFAHDIRHYETDRKTEVAVISDAILSVFDQHNTSCMPKQALISFTLRKLNVQTENFMYLRGRVTKFIKDNSKSLFIIKGRKQEVCIREAK
jgi:hypothetical protein